jgi:hypothetical protein
VDAAGNVTPVLDLQTILNRIPWDKADTVLMTYFKRGSLERIVNVAGVYLLVAMVVGVVAYLGLSGVIQGEAITGFLGAAVGYLLSRGEPSD